VSRVRSRAAAGLTPGRRLRPRRVRRGSSHPSGRAGRTSVLCGARGLNQDGGRPRLGRPDIGTSSPEVAQAGGRAGGATKWAAAVIATAP
jgi:hypothetical protein